MGNLIDIYLFNSKWPKQLEIHLKSSYLEKLVLERHHLPADFAWVPLMISRSQP